MARKKSSNHPASSTAPGQYLGYSLQTTRCLSRLLAGEVGSYISVEVFEDVGVVSSDGSKIAEQDKSALSGNPVADRSVDLWKTLANWVRSIQTGGLDVIKTRFELYVSRPVEGETVKAFSEANTNELARAAFTRARQMLWGEPPAYSLRSSLSGGLLPHADTVFGADEHVVLSLICNFSFHCGTGSSHDDLRAALVKCLVPDVLIDDTLAHALGRVKEQIDTAIESRRPAVISVDGFRKDMTAFIRKHDRRSILASFAPSPSSELIQGDLKARKYVRQLELIDAEYGERLRAVNDYLRASADRAQWGVKGLVNPDSFNEFENGLERTWENLHRKCDLEHKDKPDIDRGKLLYYDCSLHKADLEGLQVPDHFTPGSFHALSDVERVGWHPDYKNKLSGLPPGGKSK